MNWKFSCGVENLGVCILHKNRDLTSFLRIAFLGGWRLTEIIVIYCLYYILIFFGENQVDFVQIFIWKGEVCFRWCVLYTWDLRKSFWVQVYFWQVIDMDGVLAVITILETYPITRDVLEVTILKMIWIATYLTITWHQCNCRSMFYGIKLKILNVLSQ